MKYTLCKVIRNNHIKESPYYHLWDSRLSLKSKGLLSLMFSLPTEFEDVSISGLAALSKDGKDSVATALNELERYGYFKKIQMRDEEYGTFLGYVYEIFDKPEETLEVF